MAERKLIFLDTYGLPEELNYQLDTFRIAGIDVYNGPSVNNSGVQLNDTSISGVNNISFTDLDGEIGGIANKNLIDKTAAESITGLFTFGNDIDFDLATRKIWDVQVGNLLDKTASEIITGAWQYNNNISFDLATRTIAGIQVQNLIDKSQNTTITGVMTFSNGAIVPDVPVGDTHAVNKKYADAIAAGFGPKRSVRVATVGNLVSSYSNGVNGVGATLTNSGTQTALVIDGINMVANSANSVLVRLQTNEFENGIYVVTNIGSGSTNWVLTRREDFDDTPAGEIRPGDWFPVTSGTQNGGRQFYQVAFDAGDAVGVDPITFDYFSNPFSYSEGSGIDIAGNTISVDVTDIIDTNYGLTETTNKIQVKLDTNAGISFDGTSKGLTLNIDSSVFEKVTNQLRLVANSIDATYIDETDDYTWTGKHSFAGGKVVVPTVVDGSPVDGSIYWSNRKLYGYDQVGAQWVAVGASDVIVQSAGENLADADVVYSSSSDTVMKAIASSDNALKTVGLANEAITSGNSGDIKILNIKTKTGWGLVQGAKYYLSASTNGAIQNTPPTGSNWIIEIGLALTPTKLLVNPRAISKRIA
jgi:hypothetical protein